MTSTTSKTKRRDATKATASDICKTQQSENGLAGAFQRIRSAAEKEALRKFEEWQAKYRPVEEAIYAERDRKERRKRISRGRAFGDLCEMTEGRVAFCRRTGLSMEEADRLLSRRRAIHPSLEPFLMLGDMAWSAMNAIRKELTRRIARAKHIAMRPAYYEMERKRRLALATERRKIKRRSSSNPCPTKEQILDAWIKVKDSSEAMLRFGSLLEDLECYVDNSLVHDGGVIIGRRAGIKGWLQMNIPALYLKYKTVMAHKATAKRMRQIIGLKDPVPLSSVMPNGNVAKVRISNAESEPEKREGYDLQDHDADEILPKSKGDAVDRGKGCYITKGRCALRGDSRDEGLSGCTTKGAHTSRRQNGQDAIDPDGADNLELSDLRRLKAAAIYREIIGLTNSGRRNQTRLVHKLRHLTDPNAIEDANMLAEWKRFYENKITVRTKSVWRRRLLGVMRTARQGLRGGEKIHMGENVHTGDGRRHFIDAATNRCGNEMW